MILNLCLLQPVNLSGIPFPKLTSHTQACLPTSFRILFLKWSQAPYVLPLLPLHPPHSLAPLIPPIANEPDDLSSLSPH